MDATELKWMEAELKLLKEIAHEIAGLSEAVREGNDMRRGYY